MYSGFVPVEPLRRTVRIAFLPSRSYSSVFESREKRDSDRSEKAWSPHIAALLASVGVMALGGELIFIDVPFATHRTVDQHRNRDFNQAVSRKFLMLYRRSLIALSHHLRKVSEPRVISFSVHRRLA